ncbi:restriction endonuclease subunit S [Pseudarthrobacter sp. B907]|uniref:restriction endonuclease subunit S n=1 Tax=Pseudarthrobacter sp. B907 TaxID=3158261 RepID=UPI0032DBE5AC
MFHDLPRYSDTTSNFFWSSRIPSHWRVQPGLAVLQENRRKNHGLIESQVLSLSYGRVVVKPVEKQRGLVPESYEGYQVLDPGDIVVRPTDLQNDQTSIRVGHVKHLGIITSAYIGLRPTGDWSDAYAFQYLTVVDSSKRIYGMGSGLRQQLSWSDLKRMPCLVPPPEDQAAIVKYLAHANARIDKAIAAKRRLVSLLDEQKTAQIAAVFAGGGGKDAPFIPLKRLVRVMGGMTPSKENAAFWGGDIPWVSPKDVKTDVLDGSLDCITQTALDGTNISFVPRGSVVIVVRGMILARTVPVATLNVDSTINQDIKAMVPCEGVITSEYLRDWLSAHEAELIQLVETAGHGTKKLDTERLMNVRVSLPPVAVQEELSRRAGAESSATSAAVQRVRDEVALLQEFRMRLVADVVTGQVDVRAIAATLPDGPESIDVAFVGLDDDLEEALVGSEE